MLDPNKDGIDHINIYSKAQTELGQMLSNFYKFPVLTKDGWFMCVEGYWYWLSLEECPEKEELRNLWGFKAKELGETLLKIKQCNPPKDFNERILQAIWYKFRRNTHLLLPEYASLPMYHYYNYSGKVVDVTSRFQWYVDGVSKMRDILVAQM